MIWLFMNGGVSHMDTFDYKPKLVEYDGKPCPEDLIKGERFAFIKGTPRLLGTPYQFKRLKEPFWAHWSATLRQHGYRCRSWRCKHR